jgi:hypothetical protein
MLQPALPVTQQVHLFQLRKQMRAQVHGLQSWLLALMAVTRPGHTTP